MVPLVTLYDPFAARLLAARLGAEGVLAQSVGGLDGPYPLGPFRIDVEADRLDDARAVLWLGSGDADALLGPPRGADRQPAAPTATWVLLGAPLLAGVVLVARMIWFVG